MARQPSSVAIHAPLAGGDPVRFERGMLKADFVLRSTPPSREATCRIHRDDRQQGCDSRPLAGGDTGR